MIKIKDVCPRPRLEKRALAEQYLMIAYLEQFVNSINKPKYWLLSVNVFLVFFLIILNNLKVIPLQMGDFIFFSILSLTFALWRPGWAFLFFCGMIPLENINLAPVSLGLAIRPYQFTGALIIFAILARLISGRLNFKLAKLKIADYSVIVIAIASFISAAFCGVETQHAASLRLAMIFITFAGLYFLVRNYVQNLSDAKKIIPFVLSSSIVVILYGLWQNIIFLSGGNSFEVMPGRPNATFTEADWLGGYLVLLISLCYALIYYFQKSSLSESPVGDSDVENKSKNLLIDNAGSNKRQTLPPANTVLRMTVLGLYILLTISYSMLILTVSRSAWLAALVSFFIFIWIFFTDLHFKNWRVRETIYLKIKIFIALVASIASVYIFHLTDFQLLNRVQSTGSGLQKITVSCESACGRDARSCVSTGMVIQDVSELEKYNCRHIKLEEIEKEKVAGKFIAEISRPDPNVSIRSQIYQKSWAEIKNHPAFGIGWGNIGSILGRDLRGTALNSSNIFLEVWLGAGILGFLVLIFLLGYILFNSVKNYFYAKDHLQKAFNLFIIVGWFGIVIFNLFNAGLLLGFLWVWLAVAQVEN